MSDIVTEACEKFPMPRPIDYATDAAYAMHNQRAEHTNRVIRRLGGVR